MNRCTVERLARMGNAHAMCALGILCLESENAERTATEAAFWLKEAAIRGVAEAQYQLGTLFLRGWGVSEDVREAITWFERAAAQGVADAVDNLVRIHFQGSGGIRNPQKAKHWLIKRASMRQRQSQRLSKVTPIMQAGTGPSSELPDVMAAFIGPARASMPPA